MQFRPHNYQSYAIERVIQDKNLGLFLDMGLGKTVVTLSGLLELKYNRFEVNKTLIVCPKKVAEATWQNEIAKWDHLKILKVSTILGAKKNRLKALYTPADIYIINRDNVVWLVEELKNDWFFDAVVLDESSSFKNPQAKRFKAIKSIRAHVNRMIELTGTPSPNGYEDLWAQLYLLDGGERLEKSISAYRERYFNAGQRDGYVIYNYRLKQGAEQSITDKISDICVSMKSADYLELPDIITQEIPVELDTKARHAYDQMEKEAVLEIKDVDMIDAASAAALSTKLMQLANGAIYNERHEWHEIHRAKIEVFIEAIEALNGKPVIVFYQFQHDLDRIKKALNPLKLRVKKLEGVAEQEAWNRGDIDVLLTHPASSAYGLNLQAGGNHIIWFSLTWSLELYQQANKRLHRQGQKNMVIVHQLITRDSRDEDIKKALEKKEGAQDFILESLKARIKKYAKEEK